MSIGTGSGGSKGYDLGKLFLCVLALAFWTSRDLVSFGKIKHDLKHLSAFCALKII
jgi:hypothetical protein